MDYSAPRFADEFLVMGCNDNSGATGMEPFKKIKDDIGGYFVQVAGWFICEYYLWVTDNGSGNCYSLLFAPDRLGGKEWRLSSIPTVLNMLFTFFSIKRRFLPVASRTMATLSNMVFVAISL